MDTTNRKDNDFSRWMVSMGMNKLQVSKAGAMLGMGRSMTTDTSRGVRDMSMTERLAAAAVMAGIPPWSPEMEEQIKAVAAVLKLIKRARL